jgi:hypothetical protein
LARYRTAPAGWLLIPAAGVISYAATVIANSFRISIALMLRQTDNTPIWVAPDQLHRLEGIVVYFGFLVILFIVSETLVSRNVSHSTPSPSMARRTLPPLLAYYATTIGVPFVNGAFHGSLPTDEFWEYAMFVLIVPAVLLAPLALVRLLDNSIAVIRSRTS